MAERHPSYAQVARILQQALGQEEGLLVMEFFMSHMPPDVARQRDVAEVRLEMEQVRLEIEKVRAEVEQVRAELIERIEEVRAELLERIEQVRADLTKEIEQVRLEIEQVRAELTEKIERTRAEVIRWSFLFWASQMALLVGILFQLLK